MMAKKHHEENHKNTGEYPGEGATDPLLPFLSRSRHPLAQHIRSALLSDGYIVLPNILSSQECEQMTDLLWDYVETTSNGKVSRSDIHSCYPSAKNKHKRNLNDDEDTDLTADKDPWPYSKWKSFPDMFQSADCGYLLGPLREILADRVFAPLFGTSELHTSKEGFTFHRPRKIDDDHCFHPCYHGTEPYQFSVCGKSQMKYTGEHFDQSSHQQGLHTIQSSTAFVSQSAEEYSGCFGVYPGSHVLHQRLTQNTYRGNFPWVPLKDDDIDTLHLHGYTRQKIYVNAGDVILWRSDLVHAAGQPSSECTTFRAVGYVSMIPAVCTTQEAWEKTLNGYRMGRTTDHRAYLECWHENPGEQLEHPNKNKTGKRNEKDKKDTANGAEVDVNASSDPKANIVDQVVIPPDPFYNRSGPTKLTWRQAELYGLVPYGLESEEERRLEVRRALVRGVRFVEGVAEVRLPMNEQSEKTNAKSQQTAKHGDSACSARIAIVSPSDQPLLGQDKWLGGMPSPDGEYIYGVPGSATQVLRITVATGKVDFIGPEYVGKFKWLRGIEIPSHILNDSEHYPKGVCIALPSNADSVLEINPYTHKVSTYGGPFPGCWKWHGT